MTPFPYAVGDVVIGADCAGKPFEETVTEVMGPYTVKLDGIYATPVSLIREALTKAAPIIPENISAPADDLSDLFDDPAPAPQLSLF